MSHVSESPRFATDADRALTDFLRFGLDPDAKHTDVPGDAGVLSRVRSLYLSSFALLRFICGSYQGDSCPCGCLVLSYVPQRPDLVSLARKTHAGLSAAACVYSFHRTAVS